MNTLSKKFFTILFLLAVSFLRSNNVFAQAYPYCSNGICVTGYQCYPSGCRLACDSDCLAEGFCGPSDLCPTKARYYQDGNACGCWYTYGGSCSQKCECTGDCPPPAGTPVDDFRTCNGSTLEVYSRCEAYGNATSPFPDFCNGLGYDYCIESASYGNYAICCDNFTTTPCSCGCSNNACNATCTAGCGDCSSGTYSASQPNDTYKSGTCSYTNSCCSTSTANCYSPCGCTPGVAPNCDTGTSESASAPVSPLYSVPAGQTDYYSTKSTCCDRNNGGTPSNCNPAQSCNNRTCNCEICTPQTCSQKNSTYRDTLQYDPYSTFQGKVPDILTSSCRNGEGAEDQATECDLTYRNCYCTSCKKDCPTGLFNTIQTASPNLILEGFRACHNDCSVNLDNRENDCYEKESPQPTETFSIVDPGDTLNPPNGYDFKSITQTGTYGTGRKGDLNDPIEPIKMVAKFKDADLAGDIEGMFVWFQKDTYTSDPVTPVLISDIATPRTSLTDSWGFMLRKIEGSWIPYVPSYGTTNYWTDETGDVVVMPPMNYPLQFSVPGPNGTKMVEVNKIGLSQLFGSDEITLEFSLRFTNSGESFGSKADQGRYKIYTMGLDKFSFTPYDNYSINYSTYWASNFDLNGNDDFSPFWEDNQLRYRTTPAVAQTYARAWTNSGKIWTLDFTNPRVVSLTKSISGNKINVAWEVNNNGDGRDLYSVVGNIYSSGTDLERKPVNIDINSSSHTISLINGTGIFTPPSSTGSNAIVGKLNSGWSFKVEPSNLNSVTNTGSISIDVGDNTKGFIYIYLHVFDYAGNVVSSSVSENMLDRFLTGGGLSFSPSTTFAQLTPLDDSLWSGVLPPYANPSEGLLRKNAGLTSEMYANLGNPLNSIQAKSYGITGFTNWLNTTSSLYDSLLRKYELHKKYIEAELTENNISSPTSTLPSCSTTYCTYNSPGDLTVNPGLICNKKALIFVDGNLIINPPMHSELVISNLSNINGCIFVVRGTVSIQPGSRASTITAFRYDRINAFIVSDEVITIQHDPYPSPLLNPNKIVDGVYINGGLISKGGGDSIDIKRYLRLEERLVYPVFAIDLHPKYGILAEKFFGNSYVIRSTEVGLKPY